MQEAATIVATMFLSREQAHREHFKVTSGYHHEALGDFYEAVIDLADAFAETAQGTYCCRLEIPYLQPVKGSIADVLEHHIASIESARKCFNKPNETSLLNILDEVSALYSKTLFKLRMLK